MIVKLTLSQIELLVDNLDAGIRYQHQLNLVGYKIGTNIVDSDAEVVEMLGLYYQLKNLLLVERAKQDQAQQQAQYLLQRQGMLFEYMLLKADSELNIAIEGIQSKLQDVTKSIHFDAEIDVEIDESAYKLLLSKNLIN